MAKAKYTKGADGYFTTKTWDGSYNQDGTKHRVTLRSKKSSADLEKQVIELKAKIRNGDAIRGSDMLFCEYAAEWLETYKAVRSTNTRKMYLNIITHHFPVLEGIRLQDIRKLHFQMLINSAIDRPRICQQIRLTFRQVIRSAISDHLLPESAFRTICEGIELPRYKAKERRPLTDLEKKMIPKADFSPMERTFVYILYGCGLRRGEALALRKTDICLKTAELTVRQAFEFDGNNPSPKSPKSDNGYRTVPMPPYLVAQLKNYIPSVPGEYLFHNQNARSMTHTGYTRMWQRIVDKMNAAAGGNKNIRVIFGLTAHIFRHNYCTELCYQIPAISTKKIAQLLGDDEKMVLEVYSHIVDEKEKAPDVVAKALAL